MKLPSMRSLAKIAMLHIVKKQAEAQRDAGLDVIRRTEHRLLMGEPPEKVAADLTKFLATSKDKEA